MISKLKHRGPDGIGLRSISGSVHAHVRLALVDLTNASGQPFQRNGGGILSWNGEVWNFVELRESLQRLGDAFNTTGDTEVLAALLDRFGIAGLKQIDGMFALAWTDRSGTTWLARDGRGKIPLYVRREESGWTWASERKAFFKGGGVEAFEPGTAMNVADSQIVKWFEDQAASYDEKVLIEALRSGVQKRLSADAPVCCLISGGMDSAAVLAIANQLNKDVTAFTAYQDPNSEDLKSARKLCAEIGVHLVEVDVKPTREDYFAACESIEIASKAQIEIAVLCIPLAAKIASMGFKACLSGEAADELFGGYGNFCIQASRADDAGIVKLRQHQVEKMARGNFVRCNKAFMARGVECRLPFMDETIVRMAVNATKEQNPPGKKLLKKVLAGIVPQWVIKRQKETFQGAGGTATLAESLFESPKKSYNFHLNRMFGMIPSE